VSLRRSRFWGRNQVGDSYGEQISARPGTVLETGRTLGIDCPSDETLMAFVDGDCEDTMPNDSVMNHLGLCEQCQSRLADSVASIDWWSAAAEHLSREEPEDSSMLIAIPAVVTPCRSGERLGFLDDSSAEDLSISDLLEPPSHPELLGRLGRYEIERLIGRGGMGLVFRAFDPQLHRVVALKMLAPHFAASKEARERFAREARAVAALTHPHLVAIHDVVTEGRLPYLVMAYVDGPSLEQRVRREGPLSFGDAVVLGRQLTAALATAHEAGLIHRDIKPANILCEASGQRAVLTDFGLVRSLDGDSMTHTGVVAGTPHYMSPEQARGVGVGQHSDLWGVGAVLYFALTGRPPFEGTHPMAVLHQVCSTAPERVNRVREGIPSDLSAIVMRLLEKSPSDRYPDCASLRSDLERFARGETVGASRYWTANERLRAKRVSVFATLLLTLTLATLWVFGLRTKRDGSASAEARIGSTTTLSDNGHVDPMSDLMQTEMAWQVALNELFSDIAEVEQRPYPREPVPLNAEIDAAKTLQWVEGIAADDLFSHP
jgi:serine/threonine protein kinase